MKKLYLYVKINENVVGGTRLYNGFGGADFDEMQVVQGSKCTMYIVWGGTPTLANMRVIKPEC